MQRKDSDDDDGITEGGPQAASELELEKIKRNHNANTRPSI
jgi:hypothetical protein